MAWHSGWHGWLFQTCRGSLVGVTEATKSSPLDHHRFPPLGFFVLLQKAASALSNDENNRSCQQRLLFLTSQKIRWLEVLDKLEETVVSNLRVGFTSAGDYSHAGVDWGGMIGSIGGSVS
jgi:hypothetical protein